MKIKIKASKIGGSLTLTIPKIYWEHLNVKDEQDVTIEDKEGRKGKFIAIWNEE